MEKETLWRAAKWENSKTDFGNGISNESVVEERQGDEIINAKEKTKYLKVMVWKKY